MLSSPLSGLQQQRLLPGTLEDRLIGIIGRLSGYVLLVIVAVFWISLITWALTDPSLTHATGGPARNAMGPLGAILSDLLLQTLGFAAVVALLPPMLWALELILGERVLRFRTKAAFFPLSILILAGALSSLPIPAGWPLHHGLGGILGDVVFNIAANVFSLINPDRAGAASGLLFFMTGFSALMYAIGLEMNDIAALVRRSPYDSAGSWSDNLWAEAQRLRTSLAPARDGDPVLPEAPVSRAMPELRDVASRPAHRAPRTQQRDDSDDDQSPLTQPVARKGFWPQNRSDAQAIAAVSADPLARDDDFDDFTDTASQSIAQRFAPPSAARAAQSGPRPFGAGFLRGATARVRADAAPQHKRPSLNLLKRAPARSSGTEVNQTMLRGSARLLEDVLNDFGVKGAIRDIRPGPVVTLFELEPARGTKSSRIIGLADDIARSMSAVSVRVAVVPGRNAIGIELPNARREGVLLREILESEQFTASEAGLPMALGKSIGGEPVVADLARMPHLLVAGTTGSGKSVGINSFVLSLLYRHTPQDCRLLLIDPKMLELSVYNGIPHLLTPVVTDPQRAVAALNWAVNEMEERYKRMSKLSVRSIDMFNSKVRASQKRGEKIARTVQTGFDPRTGEAIYEKQELDLEPMPYIVIVVDEFADLMVVAGKEIEQAVQRLAQMARAAGIHLIMATQRPSVDVVTGTIKANFPTRISFKVASKVDSRTILNDQGAEQLLGQGDMLFSGGSGQTVRVHGPFVSDEEVEAIAEFLRQQGTPRYIEGITDGPPPGGTPGMAGDRDRMGSDDDLYDRAVAIVLRDRKASTSYVQRRLGIGYNRAADLIERMEQEGLISPANATGKREILSGRETGSDQDE